MIEVKNLTFKYAGQKLPVFEDFSLELEENRIYGLLGKNGTGKSTLLYLMAGLLRPKSGSVTVNGFIPHRRQADMLKEVFIVPEEFELPRTSLKNYVRLTEPFYPHFSHEVLSACLEEFELEQNLQLGALSMGQKKKVFMSVALAAGTQLLMMDEPTNGLDIPSKSKFRKVVAEQMSDDRTLIISTHQVHDVEALLDHILLLSQRAMLLDASVADITDRYVFDFRKPDEMEGVIYAEPSLQGNASISLRQEGEPETQLNLELLFNAVTKGLIK